MKNSVQKPERTRNSFVQFERIAISSIKMSKVKGGIIGIEDVIDV